MTTRGRDRRGLLPHAATHDASRDARRTPLVVLTALGMSAMLPAAFAQESPPAHEPGLSVRVYDVDGPMDRLLLLVPGQTPNVSFVSPVLDLRGERGDFGPIADTFVTTAEGFLTVADAGPYAFRLTSDDGSTLSLDWHVVVDADGLHSASPVDGTMELSAGEHALLVRHFEEGGDEQLTLEWMPPGATEFTLVPTSALSCQAGEVRVTSPGIKAAIHPLARGRPGDAMPLDAVHPGYDLMTIRPDGFQPKVGGMDFLPDGRLVLCTWDKDGAVWLLSGVQGNDPSKITAHRLAAGLAEPLGLCVVDGRIFVLQKQELTEILDHDNDGIADEYRCVCNDWSVSGNFHEFAFGLVYADGAFWANLAIAIDPGGRSSKEQAAERGSLVRITEGHHEIIARGLRAPNGIGLGPAPERAPGATPLPGTGKLPPIYMIDNQGDWLPSSKLLRAQRGAFYGSYAVPPFAGDGVSVSVSGAPTNPIQKPAGVRPGPDPAHPVEWPEVTPPVVWLPQGEIGNSPSQPVAMRDAPYQGQLLLGDVTYGGLQRVFVEVVDGVEQGCVFRFTQGLEAGVNRLCWGPDGALYVGGIGSTGNWGQEGKERFGLQRLRRNGRSVFEMLAVRAMTNGLEVEFTQPLAVGDGWDKDAWFIQQWRYEPSPDYGGDKLDLTELPVISSNVSEDRRRVFLQLQGMLPGHVLHLRVDDALRADRNDHTPAGARPDASARLWSTEAWITVNRIPGERRGRIDESPLVSSPNTLTPGEAQAGWKLLFNGTTFHGWHTFGKAPVAAAPAGAAPAAPDAAASDAQAGDPAAPGSAAAAVAAKWAEESAAMHEQYEKHLMGQDWEDPSAAGAGTHPDGWAVLDGAIVHTGSGGDLATDEVFANFDLRLDWRISPGGNSGILYRVTEDHASPWETGPEMQVLDNTRHADGMNPLTSAGACYALYAPPRDSTRPVGHWNHARILVQGNHVEHWLNGEKQVSYDLHSPEWEALIAASKFASMPDHGTRAAGVIVLQDHGDTVAYRNIRIRELPAR